MMKIKFDQYIIRFFENNHRRRGNYGGNRVLSRILCIGSKVKVLSYLFFIQWGWDKTCL